MGWLAGFSAFADGYWLEIHGSGHRGDSVQIFLRYGGVNEDRSRYIKSGKDLDKMKAFRLWVVDGKGDSISVPIRQSPDRWVGLFVPSREGIYHVFAFCPSLPVVERADTMQNIRPVQYLCMDYKVGGGGPAAPVSDVTDPRPGPLLDINVWTNAAGDSAVVGPLIKGEPVPAGTSLRVFHPDNSEEVIRTGDGYGILKLSAKGLYLIRLDWPDPTPGIWGGKRYRSVRHRCDYSLVVE